MSNKIKNCVINAKDIWTAITDCKYAESQSMSLLRDYFIQRGIVADSLFDSVSFDEKTGDVTFTVKHKSYPEIMVGNKIPAFKLPGLLNKNEQGQKS